MRLVVVGDISHDDPSFGVREGPSKTVFGTAIRSTFVASFLLISLRPMVIEWMRAERPTSTRDAISTTRPQRRAAGVGASQNARRECDTYVVRALCDAEVSVGEFYHEYARHGLSVASLLSLLQSSSGRIRLGVHAAEA